MLDTDIHGCTYFGMDVVYTNSCQYSCIKFSETKQCIPLMKMRCIHLGFLIIMLELKGKFYS